MSPNCEYINKGRRVAERKKPPHLAKPPKETPQLTKRSKRTCKAPEGAKGKESAKVKAILQDAYLIIFILCFVCLYIHREILCAFICTMYSDRTSFLCAS
eukprot:680947_1